MKRLLSLLVLYLLLFQLTACGINSEEGKTVTLRLSNYIDDSVLEIKVTSEKVCFPEAQLQAFQSDLSIEELKESLEKQNPDYTFDPLDEKQLLMTSKTDSPYALFSKNVTDDNGNPIDNIYVVESESRSTNQTKSKTGVCFPYHLTDVSYILSQTNGEFSALKNNTLDPFNNLIYFRNTQQTCFTDLVNYYEDYGYKVTYEGGNLTGGCISVYPKYESPLMSPTPIFQILVITDGSERSVMQYSGGIDVHELKAAEVVDRYFESFQIKNEKEYLNCYEDIGEPISIDSFFNNVKSCGINSSELFWKDTPNDEYMIKVDITYVSEEGKQIGSLGTGEINRTEYWLVKLIDGEPKIHCAYGMLDDTIRELTVYKEFEKDET